MYFQRSVVQLYGTTTLQASFGVSVEYKAAVAPSLMWLGITLLVSLMLVADLNSAYQQEASVGVGNLVLSGVHFQLAVKGDEADPSVPDAMVASSSTGLLVRVVQAFLGMGMLCGEGKDMGLG